MLIRAPAGVIALDNPTPTRLGAGTAAVATPVGLANLGRVHARDGTSNVGLGMSRAVGLKDRALAVPPNTGVMSVDAMAVRLAETPPLAETPKPLAKTTMPLAAHVVRLMLAARGPLPGGPTPSRAQTLAAAVPINRRPRASDFRKCYLALAWLPAVRPKTGSAPAALLSTANLPCSVSACLHQTNYVSMAV